MHLLHGSGRWRAQGDHYEGKKKLDVPMEAALPCKMGTEKCSKELQDTASDTTESNKKDMACVVEAHASTRKRLESTLP